MTNAPTPTRFFEQQVLVSEDGHRTIIERHYSTGEVEYWSLMTIGWQAGAQKGTAQVPFKIEIPDAFDIPGGYQMEDAEFVALMRSAERAAAFANYDAALAAAEPIAQQDVKEKLEQHQRREQSKIILAGATDPVTFGQRANGQG